MIKVKKRIFAAEHTKVSNADKPDFCSRAFCCLSIAFQLRHADYCGSANFAGAVIQSYYGAASKIASAINNDSELQTAGYHATVATVDQVNAGTHAAGDVVITRAHIPDEKITTETTSATTTAGAALDMIPTKAGAEFQDNTYTSGAQGDPAITNLSNSGFVVTWHNDSGYD